MAIVALPIAWDRREAGLVSQHEILNRYSKTHIVLEGASNYTLCGARIPWLHTSPGDSTKCERCYRVAAKRGYVTEFGDPVADEEVG